MPLLEVQGVVQVFGELRALDGVDLSVDEGQFHGLVGPNGSGKSTLMKCIAGAIVPAVSRKWWKFEDGVISG